MKPIIEKAELSSGTIFYYRCPMCKEYIKSSWDKDNHRISRPDTCRDCGTELDWQNIKRDRCEI